MECQGNHVFHRKLSLFSTCKLYTRLQLLVQSASTFVDTCFSLIFCLRTIQPWISSKNKKWMSMKSLLRVSDMKRFFCVWKNWLGGQVLWPDHRILLLWIKSGRKLLPRNVKGLHQSGTKEIVNIQGWFFQRDGAQLSCDTHFFREFLEGCERRKVARVVWINIVWDFYD